MSTAESLTKKRRIRAGHKASATRMIRQVEETFRREAIDLSKLSLLKCSLQEKLETIKILDGDIVDLIEDDKLTEEIEQADFYKETIYDALLKIDKAVCETKPSVTALRNADTPGPTSSSSSTRGKGAKLPKLALHSFDGNITEWPSFWDSFEVTIHNNMDLAEVDKFNYLTSLLEHSAREAVSGLTLTTANYHEAVAILKKRFGSKQQIISKHMDILLNVEPVTSSSNIKALRHLYDLVESHIRSLRSLGVMSESYGSLLSPVLLNKLPSEVKLIVSREVSEEEWSLDALMKVMGQEIEARERIATNQSQTQQRRTSDRTPLTAAALVSGASPSNPTCCYCQQAHSSNSCGVVTSIDSRKQILRKSGRCFSCLRKGHISRECRSVNKCPKCGGRHHSSICSKNGSTRNTAQQPIKTTNNPPPPSRELTESTSQSAHRPSLNLNATAFATPSTTTLCVDTDKAVLLQTALTDVYDPLNHNSVCTTRMILDSGSQRSYITARTKDTLLLQSVSEQCLSVAAFGSKGKNPMVCEVVRVGVRAKIGADKELTLFVVPHICDALTAQPISVCAERYNHLAQLDLADASDGNSRMEVDILVGCDYYWEFITGQTLRGDDGPIAIQTTLGWVLSGPVHPVNQLASTVSLVTTHVLRIDSQPHGTKELDDTLQSFWRLESLGICAPEKSVYDDFASSIQFKEGRYEVALPWKDDHTPLPQNYELCKKRLQGLLRRLRQEPTILQEYDTIIRDQLTKGIVQVVTNPEDEGNVHYLPHHAVIRSDKNTTKVRVVYDASARSNGPSLNDCLHTGPKFDQKILDILLRFRTHRVALTADIEKAFLMISVTERDRDFLRFLWIDDISKVNPDVIILRFARVVFGVSSSPFLLNATIKHHVEKFSSSHPELVKQLLQSIYVDDVVFGDDDEDSAYELYNNSKSILKSASFNLRKFTTNSPTLQARIDKAEGVAIQTESHNSQAMDLDETYAKYTLGATQQQLGEQRILGVRWDVSSDQILFDFSNIVKLATNLEPTKRSVVSLVGRFYDPLDFTAPVTIRFKILFQELCESKLDWDQPLSGKLLSRWSSLITDLQEGQLMSIPRCYFNGIDSKIVSCSLCGFYDASVSAYAAVVYLVIRTENGNFVKFIASKTRVAPLQRQTIPRLELLSAVLLARLVSNITNSLSTQLDLTQPRCYTDSQVTLFWIAGKGKEWKPFVQNRVDEVRSLTPLECWSHCPEK